MEFAAESMDISFGIGESWLLFLSILSYDFISLNSHTSSLLILVYLSTRNSSLFDMYSCLHISPFCPLCSFRYAIERALISWKRYCFVWNWSHMSKPCNRLMCMDCQAIWRRWNSKLLFWGLISKLEFVFVVLFVFNCMIQLSFELFEAKSEIKLYAKSTDCSCKNAG